MQKNEPRTPAYSSIGWICPVCGRGCAPSMDRCDCVTQVRLTSERRPRTDPELLDRVNMLNEDTLGGNEDD